MEKFLTSEQYDDLYNSINEEIKKLNKKLNSIEIVKVLKIMGFIVNNNQEDEYNKNERYLENF